ncbi:MAG: site-2 protease family protein [Patescibacteria group bacterium]
MEIPFIFSIIILIMSVVIHELSHGYAAVLLGDPTPKVQGRLTLNPFKHLEWFGSFIVPVITGFMGIPVGWAKPVEFNPYNLKNKRSGELLIAAAGPASNILIAVIFGLIIRGIVAQAGQVPVDFLALSAQIVGINLFLAIFNLIPMPPLDGSKILFNILPASMFGVRRFMEQYAIIFALIAIFLLWRLVEPLIPIVFSFLTGI